ncbi:30S ribosomal protein S3 [Candidatus Bathyarchaeota archaeon RBG_13_46_16b]|nr:MAG: 30S ribosomal protein S3 [Candidatus Bathyarchaeota archaeon RBG_13_46_16b]
MAVVKYFISESIKRTEIDEFLQSKLERAGYGGVSISKTPLGTHIVIYAMRPGLVIGRGGETIRELASLLEEKFQVANPQISVSEIEIPELNAYVVASKVASALQRGVHFRRAGFWALNQVIEAGALGTEIVISGKLRTERARYEKFKSGYLPKCGEPPTKYMRKAVVHVQLKPGMFGVRVRIMPPDAKFPDKIKIAEKLPPTEEKVEAPTDEEKLEQETAEMKEENAGETENKTEPEEASDDETGEETE